MSLFSLREGSTMALVVLALFVTLALLFVALVFVVVTALIAAIAFADCCEPFVVYPHSSPCHRRRTTSPPPHGLATAVLSSPSLLGFSPLADASLTRPRSSLPRRILIIAGLIVALQYFHEVQQHLPLFQSEGTCGGIPTDKRKGRKSLFIYLLWHNF